MKISYTFANGENSEVEVNEEIGTFILDSRREEDNLGRKERYHCYSLNAAEDSDAGAGAFRPGDCPQGRQGDQDNP